MTHERIKRLEAVYALWGRGDFRDTSIFAPEFAYERVGSEGIDVTGRWHGLDESGPVVREWLVGWDDYRVVAEDFRELEDARVLVDTRFVGRLREIAFDRPSADVWTFDGDQAVELVSYWDREDAYRAVGLRP